MSDKQRVILITGASSGIGAATARSMAPLAAQLFLVGRKWDRLSSVAANLGATPLQADLADVHDVQQVAEAVQQQAGHLDILINCAGQLEVGPIDQLGLDVAERLMRVNFLGAVAVIHACLPLLRRGRAPVIVNLSSVAGRTAPPYMAAYSASKFALNGYTYALRQELRLEGIHVGLVMPGPVDTPMVHGRLGGLYYPRLPGVRLLTATQVARAIRTVVERRIPEVVLPRRVAVATRLGSAFPALVDRAYGGVVSRLPQREV